MNRIIVRLGILVVLLTLALGAYYSFEFRYGNYGTGDWLVYWSVPRNALMGNGFYDEQWLEKTQRAYGYDESQEQWHYYRIRRLWNPPIFLPLLFPLAALPFDASVLLWVGLSLGLTLHATLLFNRTLARPLPTALALATPFLTVPILAAGYWGQVGPALGAFAIYAWCAHRKGQWGATGILLVPLLLKPHLFVATLTLQGASLLKQHRWAAILLPVLLVILLLGATSMLDADWLTQWRNQGAPLNWKTMAVLDLMTVGLALPDSFLLIGPLLAVGIGLFLARHDTISTSHFANSLLASMLLAPYLWYHDPSMLSAASLWLVHQARAARFTPFWLLSLILLNGLSMWRSPDMQVYVMILSYLAYLMVLMSLWGIALWADRG